MCVGVSLFILGIQWPSYFRFLCADRLLGTGTCRISHGGVQPNRIRNALIISNKGKVAWFAWILLQASVIIPLTSSAESLIRSYLGSFSQSCSWFSVVIALESALNTPPS